MAALAVGTKDRVPVAGKNKSPARQDGLRQNQRSAGGNSVLQLQGMAGNRAVMQMMRSGVLDSALQGTGIVRRMPAAVQAKMEGAFNSDFSNVRIHEGTRASSIGAQAYTQGHEIHFAPGQYRPTSAAGQKLLGHELTHVVQQREGRVAAPQGKGLPVVANPALEAEADRAGDKAARGLPVQGKLSVQLKPELKTSPCVSCRPGLGVQLRPDPRTPIQGNWFTDLFSRGKKKKPEDQGKQFQEAEEARQEDRDRKQEEAHQEVVARQEEQRREERKPEEEKPEEKDKKDDAPSKKEEESGGKQAGSALSDNIRLKGDESRDPVEAVEKYQDHAAEDVRQMGRHENKINMYREYLEADYAYVTQTVPLYKDLVQKRDELLQRMSAKPPEGMSNLDRAKHEEAKKQQTKELEKLNKAINDYRDHISQSREVEEEIEQDGKKKKIKTKVKYEEPEQAEQYALMRVELSRSAQGVVEAEKPIVDYAFEKISDIKKDLKQKYKSVKKSKNADQMRQLDEEAANSKTEAARLAKQAYLSENHVAVKRKQLKAAKATVKQTLGRGLGKWKNIGKALLVKGASIALSAGTLGLLDVKRDKTQGGYDDKTRVTFSYWENWKNDYQELERLAKSKPFGSMTTAHLFLKGAGEIVVKPLRNIFGLIATVTGLLSLIPFPPLSAVMGAIAAVCTTIAVILALLKTAIDGVLFTWNLLTLAMNNNPRNTDLLRAQTRSTAGKMIADAADAGSGFAGVAVGNAVGGSYRNAFDVMGGGLTLGGAGQTSGLGDTLLRTGSKQAASIGTSTTGKIGAAALGGGMGPGYKGSDDMTRAYRSPKLSENNPAWVNEEIRREQQMRDESEKYLRKKAQYQLAGILNDSNRAAGKGSEAQAKANLADSKTKAEAGKKGNPSEIQDSDKKNTEGIKESVKTGTKAMSLLGQNMKEGIEFLKVS